MRGSSPRMTEGEHPQLSAYWAACPDFASAHPGYGLLNVLRSAHPALRKGTISPSGSVVGSGSAIEALAGSSRRTLNHMA
jgi:hypothetical protein